MKVACATSQRKGRDTPKLVLSLWEMRRCPDLATAILDGQTPLLVRNQSHGGSHQMSPVSTIRRGLHRFFDDITEAQRAISLE
jgi:hypothetical protein